MSLVQNYEEYNKVNNKYLDFIEGLVNNNLGECDNENIKDTLLSAQNSFESIKIRIDVEGMEETDKENLNDLKYLIMDALFISADLVAFYKYKQPERFKMRATNYINKKRRAEMFKDSGNGSCRV